MEHNHKLALIIAFYFSKFDREAVTNLGYQNFSQAFQQIGKALDVKPATIKNMREQFDPYYDNPRVGWYQRQLTRSRKDVMNQYGNYSEAALREIIKDILKSVNTNAPVKSIYTKYIQDDSMEVKEPSSLYTTRGVTGKAAEELFLKVYKEGKILGYSTELEDTREHGTGYDFRMVDSPGYVFEIKGLWKDEGGILLTDNEWKTAQVLKEKYHIVLLSNLQGEVKIDILKNPCESLEPKLIIREAVQVAWYVSTKDFKI